MMNNQFTCMQENELQEVDGGIGVVEVIFGVTAVYFGIREMVRDAGRAQAYKDLNK